MPYVKELTQGEQATASGGWLHESSLIAEQLWLRALPPPRRYCYPV